MISVICRQCGKELSIDDRYAGQRGRCRACGASIDVPAPEKPAEFIPEQQHNKGVKGCLGCFGLLALIIFVVALNSSRDASDSPQLTQPHGYGVLKEELLDSPSVTRVAQHILVSKTLDEDELRQLLVRIQAYCAQQTGYEYHESPTAIFLYAYISPEQYENGMAQWVGMLSWNAEKSGGVPDIDIRPKALEAASTDPVVIDGISEARRREVWTATVQAERRARQEADAAVPTDIGHALKSGDVFELKRETPLMPEINPRDPMDAMRQMLQVEAGTRVRVRQSVEDDGTHYYAVDVLDPGDKVLGSGFINSIALLGQVDLAPSIEQNSDLMNRLMENYKAEVRAEFGVTEEQQSRIVVEAFEKSWPFPK